MASSASESVAQPATTARPGVILALLAAPVAAVLLLGVASRTPDLTGDVAFYRDAGERILAGQLPYRDFDFEYPPLSILPMLLPRLLLPDATPDAGAYEVAFLAWNAILVAILGLVLARHALRTGRSVTDVLVVFAASVAATAPVLAWRYDLAPAALLLAGVLWLETGRPVLAGVATGIGIGVKLFPGLLLPIGLAWLVALGRRRDAFGFAAAGVISAALPILCLLAIDSSSALSFLAFQATRGFQIESVTAGLLELGSALGWTPVGIAFEFKTYQITSPLAATLQPVLAAIAVALLLALATAVWAHTRRAPHDPRSCLIAYAIAAVLAFLVTNKVLSPQHLVWLVPLMPLAGTLAIPLIVVAAAALGSLMFPGLYPQLIGLDPSVVLLLNVRNLLLVVALAVAIAPHWPWARHAGQALSARPSASP